MIPCFPLDSTKWLLHSWESLPFNAYNNKANSLPVITLPHASPYASRYPDAGIRLNPWSTDSLQKTTLFRTEKREKS